MNVRAPLARRRNGEEGGRKESGTVVSWGAVVAERVMYKALGFLVKALPFILSKRHWGGGFEQRLDVT